MSLTTATVSGGDTIDAVRITANAIISESISETSTADQAIAKLAAGQCTEVKSSGFTAVSGFHYLMDTATQTVTLPASPTIGDQVKVTVGNFVDTVIARNGSTIMALGQDLTIDVANMGVTLIYTNAVRGWVLL